ncbi:MAG: DUF2484 family protein [Pseudomonadota bacterium]
MSAVLLACIAWVFASTAVALLPMRDRYVPGVLLIVAAPGLIFWVRAEHGWGLMAFGLFAFLSMFRNPLRYVYQRARGDRPEVPS